MPKYITTAEAAEQLGFSENQVKGLIKAGRLDHVWVSGKPYLNPENLTVKPGNPPKRGGGAKKGRVFGAALQKQQAAQARKDAEAKSAKGGAKARTKVAAGDSIPEPE